MKKLLLILSILTAVATPAVAADATKTITASGTVIDAEDNKPLAFINVMVPDAQILVQTDENGQFTLKNIPAGTKIRFSSVGHETQLLTASENMNINMKTKDTLLDEAVVKVCKNKEKGIKYGTPIDDNNCIPSACIENRWKLAGEGDNAKCVEQKCEIVNGTGEWKENNNGILECKLKNCRRGYEPNPKTEPTECIEKLTECTPAQKAKHPNATKTGIKRGTNDCIARACKCGFDLQDEKCVEWQQNAPCDKKNQPKLPENASAGIKKCDNDTPYCEVSTCNDGYKPSDDKKSCISIRGDSCDATTIDANATAGEYKKIDGKMTCIITDCAHGYKPNDNGTKCVAGQLSESDSQAKVDELRDNAQAMRDKEQSTANKLLGAAGIGATGIGGMQMASAMAEQSADEDAETAMRAYLATFHCNYGGGQNIHGGKTNVELPGGNELIDLYSEYVNLANDLKVRKTALDMRPGIESESILDAATSGLYDDVAIGKTSGAYTSLARALMDPNGADAAAWAQQKSETANKKKTGMITAGIGAAGSLVGNLAINSGKDKQNKLDEILNKYDNNDTSAKTTECIDKIVELTISENNKVFITCPDDTTKQWHELDKTDAFLISTNWDYDNLKLYDNSDNIINDYEQDACETLQKLEKYIQDKKICNTNSTNQNE